MGQGMGSFGFRNCTCEPFLAFRPFSKWAFTVGGRSGQRICCQSIMTTVALLGCSTIQLACSVAINLLQRLLRELGQAGVQTFLLLAAGFR